MTDPAHEDAAALLPHALDPQGRIAFVQARVDALRRAAFLDGRERFWESEGPVLPVDAFADLPAQPRRLLLHMAFGGSTMAARALDAPGHVLALREPAIEIALADAAAQDRLPQRTLAAVDALLSQPVHGDRTFSKPSNWANVLAPRWAATDARVSLITIAPRPYLLTAFRGGRERLAYILRSAVHFSSQVEGGNALLGAANSDPAARQFALTPAARMVLVALHLQYRLLAMFPHATAVDAADLRADPPGTLAKLALGLDLDLDARTLERGLARLAGRHAKADTGYDRDAEAVADADVERHHAAVFDAALDWAQRHRLDFSLSPRAQRHSGT